MDNFIRSYLPNIDHEAPCVLIYTDSISNRLTHTCNFVFNQVLQIKYRYIQNRAEFLNYNGICLNLNATSIPGALHLPISSFILEKNISLQKFQIEIKNQKPLLKQFNPITNCFEALDLFSSIFFFISRHEEWCCESFDQHGRFELPASILNQHKLYLQPIVDQWIHEFKKNIQGNFPQIKLPVQKFQVISTIDVDNVFAFKGKPFLRALGGSVKNLISLDFKSLTDRIKCLAFNGKDPFDIYEDISSFCQKNQIPLAYFFLFKSGTKYDRSIEPTAPAFKQVFKQILDCGACIGLHPSYHSPFEFGLLKNEKDLLIKQSAQSINMSRQHFLRFDIKTTPQLLMKHGFIADFTMGFASSPGFRAGTSHPFYYYDFHEEKTANLLMVPFCAMDGAYSHYSKTSAETAYNSLIEIGESIKKVGGFFTFVYHERSFYNHLYKDYGSLYKKLILALK